MQLCNLKEVFENRIFRIPDYQRGYAWKATHVQDFWEDLISLPEGRMHYTGLITLEPIQASDLKITVEGGKWLECAGHKFYYVVDGQQRLTTFIILIQAILDRIADQSIIADAESRYIGTVIDNYPQNKCYKFGYDSDESSQSFLTKHIFQNKYSISQNNSATVYTKNIKSAYNLFIEKINQDILSTSNHGQEKLEKLYKKLTNNILFNIFETTKDIDIFVTFETMNNRGKSLTNLELLKNRLIYLTSLFDENSGKEGIRKSVNTSWKTIYSYLGRNPNKELNDDVFLQNHWIMSYPYDRSVRKAYIKDLLDNHFSRKSDNEKLLEKIEKYAHSLQVSVKWWFILHNPRFDNTENENPLSEDHRKRLDRLNRLGYKSFRPLLMACFLRLYENNKHPSEDRAQKEISDLLMACERFNFLTFNVSQKRSNTGDSSFYKQAREVLKGKDITKVTTEINDWTTRHYSYENLINLIKNKYRDGQLGFYHWDGIRYFLYEYNIGLNNKSKQPDLVDLPNWPEFAKPNKNNETIEHIYPQNPSQSPVCNCEPQCSEMQCSNTWAAWYKNYDDQQRHKLLHSLGNLVPLSRSKNSSLTNDEFGKKIKTIRDKNAVGFFNGTAAENEIAQEITWKAEQILKRGLKLLDFLETRWQAPTRMNREEKVQLLQLDFIKHS